MVRPSLQVHGAAGVSQDFFLAYAFAQARTLRLADGPDEVPSQRVLFACARVCG